MPCPIQAGRSQGSSVKAFSVPVTLSLVLFFMFSSFLHPPALCLLPFFFWQFPMWSLFFPPSASPFFLSLAGCAKLPPIHGAAILYAWWTANRTLSTKCLYEQHDLCSPAFCIRWKEPLFIKHGSPLRLRSAVWVSIPWVQVNLSLNGTCSPVPASKSRTHLTQQIAQLEQAIYSCTWSSDKIMDML